jgi:hypothetical protein
MVAFYRRIPAGVFRSSMAWRSIMLIDGWQINENELHGFDRKWRAKWHAWDRLFECTRSDVACLIYSIGEVAMNRLVGRLAIYQYKAKPTLLLNPREFQCRFWDSEVPVDFSGTGRILFVKGGAGSDEHGSFCVIDLDTRRFAVVRKGEPGYTSPVHEITERQFRMDFHTADGNVDSALLNLDELEWHDLRKL